MLLIDCLKCTNFTRVTGFRNDEVTGNLRNPETTGFRRPSFSAKPVVSGNLESSGDHLFPVWGSPLLPGSPYLTVRPFQGGRGGRGHHEC